MGILRVRVLLRETARILGRGLDHFFIFAAGKIAKHIIKRRMLGLATPRIHWTCYPPHLVCARFVRE